MKVLTLKLDEFDCMVLFPNTLLIDPKQASMQTICDPRMTVFW